MSKHSIGATGSFNNSGWSIDEEPVLSPDILTPAQYYQATVADPCHHLLAAVLEDAIRCFQKNFEAKNTRRHIMFQEAEEWLFETDGTRFMSCPLVCENLGIDVVPLKRYLREWQRRVKTGRDAPRLGRRSCVPPRPINSTSVSLTHSDGSLNRQVWMLT
jgi:hypothetical protein